MEYQNASQEEVNEEIAKYGRKYLLWELASDGRSLCGVSFVARELAIEDQSLEHVVYEFVNDVDKFLKEGDKSLIDWEYIEEQYGGRADKIMSEE